MANKIYNDIRENGASSVEDLYERTMTVFDEETGKSSVKKIYTDSVLAKLSLPVPPELTDEEKELAKKFKIATSKLSKLAVRKKIKYFIENPPYEITEKDKALAKILQLKVKDFETTRDFKTALDNDLSIFYDIAEDKMKLKIDKIIEKYSQGQAE